MFFCLFILFFFLRTLEATSYLDIPIRDALNSDEHEKTFPLISITILAVKNVRIKNVRAYRSKCSRALM